MLLGFLLVLNYVPVVLFKIDLLFKRHCFLSDRVVLFAGCGVLGTRVLAFWFCAVDDLWFVWVGSYVGLLGCYILVCVIACCLVFIWMLLWT